MSFKVYFHPLADEELMELSEDRIELVKSEIDCFKEEGLDYENFGWLTNEKVGIECYRLKVKEEKPVKINQRLILDLCYESFVVYGVEHREDVYSEDYLKEIKGRKYE